MRDHKGLETIKSLLKLIKSYVAVKSKISTASEVKAQLLRRLVGFVEKELKFLEGMAQFSAGQLQIIYKTKTLTELDDKYREFAEENARKNQSFIVKESPDSLCRISLERAGATGSEARFEENEEFIEEVDIRQPNKMETSRMREF